MGIIGSVLRSANVTGNGASQHANNGPVHSNNTAYCINTEYHVYICVPPGAERDQSCRFRLTLITHRDAPLRPLKFTYRDRLVTLVIASYFLGRLLELV